MALPLYLFTGPEFGKRNDAVDEIKKAAKKKFGDVDEHLFYLIDTSFGEIVPVLEGGTLFSAATCVVCKNAELLKKADDINQLKKWLENIEKASKNGEEISSILILISDDISVDAKLEKLIPGENRKKFWEMYENEKLPWVSSFFQKNGYKIKSEAAQLILDMVENNTEALRNECSRFFVCFPKEHTITDDDVSSILIHNREENAFTLFNQISNASESAEKRFEAGIEILQKILLSKDNSPVMIIVGLASCFRKLVLWHKINAGGTADATTLKSNGFSSSTMQKQYRNAARIWTVGQATAILAVLASTDMETRSSGTLLEEVYLQKMLYEIVVKKGASLAVADYNE
ncbi:MAG: DNA polymerase III subunit delta [Treponema sp.]|nr:DNA polymerase III subunit delta [Treponema sp.]